MTPIVTTNSIRSISRAAVVLVTVLASLPSLTSCRPDSYRQAKKEPTEEEREVRAAFVRGADLDPVLDRQLVAFEITPQDALRRQAYVDSLPERSSRVRSLVLRGQFVLHMTPEQVEASWGPADHREDISVAEHTRIRWRYMRPAGPYSPKPVVTRLIFEDGRLVDIRESSS